MDTLGTVVFTIIVVSALFLFINVINSKNKKRQEKESGNVSNNAAVNSRNGSDTPDSLRGNSGTPSGDVSPSEATANDEERLEKRRKEKNEQTLSLMMLTLRKLGCQPEIEDNSENRVVMVKYQGETFRIIINGYFVRIWDPAYLSTNKLDTNLPLIADAINTTNYGFGPAIVLSDPDENGEILVHSRMDFLFVESIGEIEDYLAAILSSFFDAKQSLKENMEKSLNPGNTGIHSKSFNPSEN